MIKTTYQLCRIFGIPIYLDLSLIILMFIYIRAYGSPVQGISAGVILLVSITLHELGHSLMARAFGCRVRDITLMIIGGRASLETMPRKYWQEFLVAAAGPAVSLALGVAGTLGPGVLYHLGLMSSKTANFLAGSLGLLNIGLLIFNLLPAFPMDGGRILRAALQVRMSRVRATWVASRIGRVIAGLMIFFALCNIFNIPLPMPKHPGILGQLFIYFIASGTFIQLLIGWMIYTAAEAEYRQVLMESGGARNSPFAGFPFFGRSTRNTPPPDDGHAVVSPPPYERGGSTRLDVRKEE
jgi:Zn-dependent protease